MRQCHGNKIITLCLNFMVKVEYVDLYISVIHVVPTAIAIAHTPPPGDGPHNTYWPAGIQIARRHTGTVGHSGVTLPDNKLTGDN